MELNMLIYTSYFDNLKNIPKDIIPIAICGKSPDWYDGIEYKKLAPKYSFFQEWKKNGDNNYYIEHFNKEVLDKLSAAAVYEELEDLCNGGACVLICYEKPDDFCHRHLVADWLETNLNIYTVKEWRNK
jgi:uncharacterized protein YeaO (DUF488 family)